MSSSAGAAAGDDGVSSAGALGVSNDSKLARKSSISGLGAADVLVSGSGPEEEEVSWSSHDDDRPAGSVAVPAGVTASMGRVAARVSCCSAARRPRHAASSHSSIVGSSCVFSGSGSNSTLATVWYGSMRRAASQ